LTQSFFAHLLDQNPFQELAPSKGRFRSFLLAALGNHLADELDRKQAAKRGGGRAIVSLDEAADESRYEFEPRANIAGPEKEFDRRWALAILEKALDALGREQEVEGKRALFDRLKEFLTDPTGNCDYTEAAIQLNKPPNTIAVTVRRLRLRYRELVRAEITLTLANPADVDAEMGHFLAALRG
jgi:RNA polymerase sigma-70 factor (ECF subfamily)